ncbi:MAG: DUF4301 family protein [Bacteroidetes bacterium]|nr:DUF4301 family protein [Bacteroidota bacterium]
MLQPADLYQIEEKGIPLKMIENQLNNFRTGFPFIRLIRPAILNDGIITFSLEKKNELVKLYEEQSPDLRVLKFVPASGAASRMFKHLFELREAMRDNNELAEVCLSDTGFNSASNFFLNLTRFAFFNDLAHSVKSGGTEIETLLAKRELAPILDHLLTGKGLNYASLPKALLLFHAYEDGPRTALEEHLVESANYTRDRNEVSKIHFTISPEHIEKFNEKVLSVREKYESRFHTRLNISHSVQKSSTDTLAVDEANTPFRNPDGKLLFRPAGHGALLSNLNDLEADVIFIKNIDNIVPDHIKAATLENKKLIGGYLLQIRRIIFDFLRKCESGKITGEEIREITTLTGSDNLVSLPPGFEKQPEETQCRILAAELNRPIRICGMVKNAGEPGGGPFWVAGPDGSPSLQIVESSQVDMSNKAQTSVFGASTHFNPVDLVCCTTDYKGNPFNLYEFVDNTTGFISVKSSGGRTLKAQELPGLWNGSMAGWITLFVEVPLATFNPVKTINDLLRDEHQ